MENKYFKQALSDFTIEFASGDAIRALSDKGYSVNKIKSKLDFPTTEDKIRDIVWKHYIDNKTICLSDPANDLKNEKVTYEKVTDSYGRISFKQIVVKTDEITNGYIACDFGKMIYQNKDELSKLLAPLDEEEKDYIMGLPWPLTRVWHVKNEVFEKISSKLQLK